MVSYENANMDTVIRNVYGTGIDIQNSERILGTKWYNYVQTDQSGFVIPTSFSSNDIILGGTEVAGGIGNVDLNGGIRIEGSDSVAILNSLISYVGIRSVYGSDDDVKIAQTILGNTLFNYISNGSKNLVEYPIEFVRGEVTEKVNKIIYGLGSEQWSDELIRNMEGMVYQIKTTLPNGTSTTVEIKKDAAGKVNKIE